MAVYSKFLSLISGVAQQVDLSLNTLEVGALELKGATAGTLTQNANASTTPYSIFWPATQAAGGGYLLTNDGSGNLSWAPAAATGVTSVAFADASTTPIYNITGTPVTSTGTLTQTLITQLANSVFAGPTTGSAAQPTFRALVAADIPSLAYALQDLSNLTATAINQSLIPNADSTFDLGASALEWANVYTLNVECDEGTLSLTGDGGVLVQTGTNGSITLHPQTGTGNVNIHVNTKTVTFDGTVVDVGTQKIVNVTNPTASQDAMTLIYANTHYLELTGGNTMTGAINLGGFTPTNSGTPVNPNDLVSKSYVDNFINATSWKTAALVATTANITLSGEQTIDGVLTSASRVLVKNQTSQADNGLYTSAAGAWTRTTDMNSWAQVPAAAVFIESGTVNADLGWVCTSQPGGTLGTTAITFVQFSSAGAYSADGVTLQLISGVFSVKSAGITETQIASSSFSTTGAIVGGSGTKISVQVDNSTIDINGSNQLEVKANGITNTQINSAAAIAFSKLASLPSADILVGNGSNVATAVPMSGDVTISNTGATTIGAGTVTATKLATVTDGVTLDQSGPGSTLEVKAAGIGTTQLANASVTAAKLGTVTDGITADQNGAGSTIEVLNAPSVKRTLIAGQSFTANTSYAVRWGLTSNGESSNRVYAADITTTSFNLFYVIGMASSGTSVSAGQNIVVTSLGSFTLSSADSAFGSNTDGTPVYLTASGTFSTTAPTTATQAVTRIGMVQARSATVTSNIIDVDPVFVAIN